MGSDELRSRVAAKVMGFQNKEEPTITEVEKKAKDMEVVDKTLDTARRLSGADLMQDELKRRDQAIENAHQKTDEVLKDLEEARLNNVKAELGGKLDALTEMYNKGANRQSIGEQITEVKKVADNLGYGTSKVSELKEMWTRFKP